MAHSAYPTSSDLNSWLLAAGFEVSDIALLDLTTMAAAGADLFREMTGRQMLAATQTRDFDRPCGNGVLNLKADLLSVSSLTDYGTALTANTDYRLEPLNAADDGKPYNRIRFSYWRRWGSPILPYTLTPAISITGSWGYGATIPNAAFTAMLALGALSQFANLMMLRTGGMIEWREADMQEEYGPKPFQALLDGWTSASGAVKAYRRMIVA